MSKYLFLGSSLTTAFYDWHRQYPEGSGADKCDFLMCHGAFWIPSRLIGNTAFEFSENAIRFPRNFQVYSSDGTALNQQFFGTLASEKFEDGSIEVNLSRYARLIFTVPLLFNDVSFNTLFHKGFGLYTEDTKQAFLEAGLENGLSDAAFLAIHRNRFGHAYDFLEKVSSTHPKIELYVAPAVMPPESQKRFPLEWRKLHQFEQQLVFNHFEQTFGTVSMKQPEETLTPGRATKMVYMADDIHHYNAEFVQCLFDETGF